jgi:hypothetical protein
MTSPSQIRALAAKHDVDLDLGKEYRVYQAMAWSPAGKTFSANGAHCYALEAHGYYTTPDWNVSLTDLRELIKYGFEDCDVVDCDVCKQETV